MTTLDSGIFLSPAVRAQLAVQAIEEATMALKAAYMCNPHAVEFFLPDMGEAGLHLAAVIETVSNRRRVLEPLAGEFGRIVE